MKKIIIYSFVLICSHFQVNAKSIKDSLVAKELIKILTLSNLSLQDSFTIDDTIFNYSGLPCAFQVSITEKDHFQMLEKIKKAPNVQREKEWEAYFIKTINPPEGTIYIHEHENWIAVRCCPPNGTSELLAILKQENLILYDEFFIKSSTIYQNNYCGFEVQISELDKKKLVELIKNKPIFQEDSLKLSFQNLNGVKISVYKNELLLEIDGFGEVPYIDYPNEDMSWFDKVKIPKRMKFKVPNPKPEELHYENYIGFELDSIKKEGDFVLVEGFQPGLYSYEIGLKNIEKGAIYLKAYEVSTNHQLSAERLYKESLLEVETKDFKKYVSDGEFLIQEGKNHRQYLARFEVWHKGYNDKPEKKIAEKIYKIEGWER